MHIDNLNVFFVLLLMHGWRRQCWMYDSLLVFCRSKWTYTPHELQRTNQAREAMIRVSQMGRVQGPELDDK